MKKKSNKFEFFLLLIFVILLGVLVYFYFFRNNAVKDNYPDTKSSEIKLNAKYENQKTGVISSLSLLKKYGDWPQIPFQLSQSRGNPFQEKTPDNNK